MTILVRPQPARGEAARLGLFYAASFLVIGVQMPFWSPWLNGRGLGAEEIALVFALSIWANVVATPAVGALADRFGRRRAVMILLAALSCAAYAGLWPALGFAPLIALNLIAGSAQSALMPLGDSITLAAVKSEGIVYGRVRAWGSASFVVGSFGAGALLALGAPMTAGDNRVLGLVLIASLLLLAATLGMPRAGAIALRRPALGGLAADRRFWLFVASAALLQSSHQLYYGFGTLYWREEGFSDAVIGALWAEGVVAEIVLFWCSRRVVARGGPLALMALGGIAGIVRWSLVGTMPGLAAAAGLQLLHALTFGATHLGAMHFIAGSVPPGVAASAQSFYTALSAALGGLVMLAAGALYAAYGGHAYPAMALLSAAGLIGVWRLWRTAR